MKILGLGLAVLLTLAAPAVAQVSCLRYELAFSCADGTMLAIYDDPWGGFAPRVRGGAAMHGDRAGGGWWKDDRYVYGPDGQVCLQHSNHVHCGGVVTDRP